MIHVERNRSTNPSKKSGVNVPSTSAANVLPSGARFRFHRRFGCALYPKRSHFSKNKGVVARHDEVAAFRARGGEHDVVALFLQPKRKSKSGKVQRRKNEFHVPGCT